MRIGISTSVIQRGKAGISQYLFAILRAFSVCAKDHQFFLFTLEQDVPLFGFVPRNMEIIPVPEKFRPALKDIVWHQTELPRLARELRLDVLHVPSYRRMLWPQPCALVATIHDLAPFHVAKKYDAARMFYGRFVARYLAERQHEIIAVSESTASDIRRFFRVPPRKISVVHNGVDHSRFRPASKELAKKVVAERHGIDAPFFVYIARLEHPAKNHIRLIEAFENYKSKHDTNWQLVFGGSDWHGADIIHQRILRSPFARDIRCLGFINDNDLPDVYRAADVFVYPSLYEGFGLPVIEAMACGCPVICSDRGSLGEVAGSAAKIIDPENVSDIEAALEKLSRGPLLREEMKAQGFAQAQMFDWNRAAACTLEVFKRAAQNFSGKLVADPVENFSPGVLINTREG